YAELIPLVSSPQYQLGRPLEIGSSTAPPRPSAFCQSARQTQGDQAFHHHLASAVAGAPPSKPIEGFDLLQPPSRSRRLYWEHEGNQAIRDGEWKLVPRRSRSERQRWLAIGSNA